MLHWTAPRYRSPLTTVYRAVVRVSGGSRVFELYLTPTASASTVPYLGARLRFDTEAQAEAWLQRKARGSARTHTARTIASFISARALVAPYARRSR